MNNLEPTKIYLAAKYEMHPLMREFRDWLQDKGFIITSRWIDLHGDKVPTPFSSAELAGDFGSVHEQAGLYAQHDVEDVEAADWLICFSIGGGGRGGRHVEWGIGINQRKRLTLIGPREHVFHCLPQVEVFPDLETFKLRADLD